MSFRACAVIPVFDHEHALPLVVQALRQRGLRRGVAAICIGGGEATAMALELND